ncbi:hypothetical protein LNKW23_11850 [Paralimibaculum aggregatum]|uniref:Uncharacterized protein n=1 Tax=Paralimibaculum aggregatum TaxID=3036245 RepID=A0ABQ6LG52_9RHOB|nr:hypothetical protein [Limibaculum sp. NKW23]GMG81972.1 hypothetical protein LNKW23_11850 [Limibaculum sp. NKW23]
MLRGIVPAPGRIAGPALGLARRLPAALLHPLRARAACALLAGSLAGGPVPFSGSCDGVPLAAETAPLAAGR